MSNKIYRLPFLTWLAYTSVNYTTGLMLRCRSKQSTVSHKRAYGWTSLNLVLEDFHRKPVVERGMGVCNLLSVFYFVWIKLMVFLQFITKQMRNEISVTPCWKSFSEFVAEWLRRRTSNSTGSDLIVVGLLIRRITPLLFLLIHCTGRRPIKSGSVR